MYLQIVSHVTLTDHKASQITKLIALVLSKTFLDAGLHPFIWNYLVLGTISLSTICPHQIWLIWISNWDKLFVWPSKYNLNYQHHVGSMWIYTPHILHSLCCNHTTPSVAVSTWKLGHSQIFPICVSVMFCTYRYHHLTTYIMGIKDLHKRYYPSFI
jgi:hypothetical protein